MGEHHFLICRKHFERMEIEPSLFRHDVNLVPLVEQTLTDRKIPDLTVIKKFVTLPWLEKLLQKVLRFQERHKDCDVFLTSDYALDLVGEDEQYYWQVEWDKPFHNKEEFDRRVVKILDEQIEAEHKVWSGMLIIMCDDKYFEFFKMKDGKLGLGFVQEGVGGYGGAIGPDFDTEEECLKFLQKEENRKSYDVKGKLEIIKHSGDMDPYTNAVENMFRRRLSKLLDETDFTILNSFHAKHEWDYEAKTFSEIAEETGLSYSTVKTHLEKLNDFFFVSIWYPAKEKVHIVARGYLALKEKLKVK